MSGGHFDYVQYRIESAAEDIRWVIDDDGHRYSAKTLERFRECEATLRKAAKMVHRVDYLVCDDDSEESFHSQWDEEIG